MTKTRSQTGNKKGFKDTQFLHSVNNTAGNNNKITTRRASKRKSNILPAQKVKVEQDTDAGSLLGPSPKLSKRGKKRFISQEQINQLIRYVVNDKISISQAASKLKIRCETASYYFNLYNNDPKKKIPIPLWQLKGTNACTQEQIATLIKSIVDDGMTILAASALSNMNYDTGRRYYRKYLDDPKRTIPVQRLQESIQERINNLISYIVDGKMSLYAASKKAKMGYDTSKKYYDRYLNDPNHGIPTANPLGHFGSLYTQDQKNRLISFIVNDKMSIRAASKKADISQSTGFKYYRRYLNDHPATHRVCSQDNKIKQLTGYNEKTGTGEKYHPRHDVPTHKVKFQSFSEEQINTLIRYIVDDKMTLTAASKKVKMSKSTGSKYYHEYLNDTSITDHPLYTQEQVTNLFRYIIDDKMSVEDASKKADMSKSSGPKYQ